MTKTAKFSILAASALVLVAGGLFAIGGPTPAVSVPTTAPAPAPAETWDERVATLNCDTNHLPGWLDESGLPSGCVENWPCVEAMSGLPCPGDVPAAVVEPVEPAPVPVQAPPAPVESVTPKEGC